METTLIRKVKRPSGATGLWAAYVLDEDEHGLWLFSPKGSTFRAEQNGRVLGVCEVGQGARAAGVAVMQLVPRHAWWIAHVYGEHEPELFTWPSSATPGKPGRRAVAIDICQPPTHLEGAWTYVDLELDLLADAAGAVFVDDEDEFKDRCDAGVISASDETSARAATSEMEARLRACDEPFNQLSWERFDSALAMNLPPLRSLP